MKKVAIWVILVFAFLVRFVLLIEYPVGFNADEASFGYDAYSILKTGKDQWGNTLPLVFKSFGDYKSPVYGYLTVPSVAVFGLNVFATRLPGVIVGTLAVLAVYLLVNMIVNLKKISYRKESEWLGHVGAILLAFNPWSVMMSRGAFEANLITLFLPLGIYFFLKAQIDTKYYIWSSLAFGINLFTYHSAKFITPIVLVGLIYIFRKSIVKIKFKKILPSLTVFFLFFGAFVYSLTIGGVVRIAERSITQGALVQGFEERMDALSEGVNPIVAKILHNRYQVIAGKFIYNYFQYYSPKFLVNNGAGDGSYGMMPGIGVVNYVEIILFFGIIPLLIFGKKFRNTLLAILIWLVITPIPAALATGIGYSGNRANGMIPVLQIIGSFGIVGWGILLRKFKGVYFKTLLICFGILLIFGAFRFVESYFKVPSNLVLRQEIYGSLEVATWLKENSKGREVIISRSLTETQIFVAFANVWDPNGFQKSTETWGFDESNLSWVDQLPSYSVGNYTFKSIDPKIDMVKDRLIVLRAEEFLGEQIPIKVFYYPDGTPNIYILDINQKIYAQTL